MSLSVDNIDSTGAAPAAAVATEEVAAVIAEPSVVHTAARDGSMEPLVAGSHALKQDEVVRTTTRGGHVDASTAPTSAREFYICSLCIRYMIAGLFYDHYLHH